MFNERDIAWFAGLFEGEGYVARHHGSAVIEIGMTDREPLERCESIFGGKLRGPEPRKGNRKDRYRWFLHGADAVAFVYEEIQDWLSPRRQQQFEEVLAAIKPREERVSEGRCSYEGNSSRGADRHRSRGEAPCRRCRDVERAYNRRKTGVKVTRV